MIIIRDLRTEKAARRLARKLGVTISEAVAVACERLLGEQDKATLGKRRGKSIDRMRAEIRRRGVLKGRLPAAADRQMLDSATTTFATSIARIEAGPATSRGLPPLFVGDDCASTDVERA